MDAELMAMADTSAQIFSLHEIGTAVLHIRLRMGLMVVAQEATGVFAFMPWFQKK